MMGYTVLEVNEENYETFAGYLKWRTI